MLDETLDSNVDAESTATGTALVDEADRAARDGRHEQARDLYLEAAQHSELPAAELCVKLARTYERLGDLGEAYAWLTRVVDAPVSFLQWNAAASTLTRLTERARPEARRSARLAVTGSYTTSQLTAMLPLAALHLGVDLAVVYEGGFAQYQQDLIDGSSALYASRPDVIVLAVHEGALRLPPFSDTPAADVEREAERWQALWRAVSLHSKATIVQHGFARRPELPYGHLSAGTPGTRFAMVDALNRRLYETADDNVSLVDADRLAADFGRDGWFDDPYWVRSKQGVALEALPLLARHTAALVAARLGLARKCLVVDLDNTLWGGIVGEDGPLGVAVGGEGIGEAYSAFQDYIRELKDRGVILAIASKNNEADVREAFESHPGMRLHLEDFATVAVNWDDKPANLRRIAATLNIGTDALVLVDDNPAERQIVRQILPEVDVVTLPSEPTGYRRALSRYLGFETVTVTTEDRQRTADYRARAAAAELSSAAADIESFYRDLHMHAVIAPFDEEHLPRIAQLVQKTNQFNLTTRRYSAAELRSFMSSESHLTRYLTLSDRFTHHGLVALLIGSFADGAFDIDTFLMSCRVIGRTVEAQLLAHVTDAAARLGCEVVRGTYVPSAKNQIVRDLYERFDFREIGREADGATLWEYDLREGGPILNEFIEVREP
jgi:FkbH-like protein